MKTALICISAIVVAATGAHGGPSVAAAPLIVGQAYVTAPAFIAPPQRFIVTPRSFRSVVVVAPRLYAPQPIYTQRTFQPVRRTIIQQPVQRTVVTGSALPLEYDDEDVEEVVFRTPISKTVENMPDDVTRIKKTVNQHFPMLHEQVTDHFTVQDTEENNYIHHFYQPEDKWSGVVEGKKFTTGPVNVDHPGESFEGVEDIETKSLGCAEGTTSNCVEALSKSFNQNQGFFTQTRQNFQTRRAAPNIYLTEPVLRAASSAKTLQRFAYSK